MSRLFHIYLSCKEDDVHEQDVARLRSHSVRPMVLGLSSRTTLRNVVRQLANTNCDSLILPDDPARHTALMECVKTCARQLGIPVRPITHFLKPTPPAAASAVPASQHHAVAGT